MTGFGAGGARKSEPRGSGSRDQPNHDSPENHLAIEIPSGSFSDDGKGARRRSPRRSPQRTDVSWQVPPSATSDGAPQNVPMVNMSNRTSSRNTPAQALTSPVPSTLSARAAAKRLRWGDYLELLETRRYIRAYYQHDERRPYVVYLLWIVQIIVFIAEIIVNGGFAPVSEAPFLGPSTNTLLAMGGMYPPRVRGNLNEYGWTMLTANFLHAGVFHLLINMAAEWAICIRAEKYWGSFRMLAMLLITGVTGMLTTAMYRTRPVVTVGASGMICGVLGVVIGENIRNWGAIFKPWVHLVYWLVNVAILLLVGLAPVFDNMVHTSSFICGFFLAFALCPCRYDRRLWWREVLFVLLGVTFVTVYWGVGFSMVAAGTVSSCTACCYLLLSLQC